MASKLEAIIYSPVSGTLKNLESISTNFFYRTFNKDGIAIEPEGNCLFSPIDGKVTNIFDTKHSLQITSNLGVVINIYVGINTDKLFGEGFTCVLSIGDEVKKYQPILFFDPELIEKNKMEKTIILGFSNPNKNLEFKFFENSHIESKKMLCIASRIV